MRFRTIGLCLFAALVIGAMGAASASAAEPAFYECAKVKGGKYEDKACSKLAGSEKGEKYELKEGIGKKPGLKGKGGHSKLETPGFGAVECTSLKDSATLTSPTHISKILTEYKGCTTAGKKCNSPGAKAGTIKTDLNQGDLGYINKAKTEVGIDITPESGPYLAELECEGVKIVTEGSVIGHQSPVNTFTKETVLSFFGTAGKQSPENLEGQPKDVLETSFVGLGGPFESYQEQLSENKGEFLEIKA